MIVDIWVNLQNSAVLEAMRRDPVLAPVHGSVFGIEEPVGEYAVDRLLADMDSAGIDVAIVSGTARLGASAFSAGYTIDEVLECASAHPDRLRGAMLIDSVRNLRAACSRIEALARQRHLSYIQVAPIVLDEPINSPRLYPIYERCEALGMPVSVNVGMPGPRYRMSLQDPALLDDVLIDFPDLMVIGSHMGHPWESLMVALMRKYPNLYLANTAFLAKYIHRDLLEFMRSRVGSTRLLFASDGPMIPLDRALKAAQEMDLPAESKRGFLGANACSVLGIPGDGATSIGHE